jgi:hypothetical protein
MFTRIKQAWKVLRGRVWVPSPTPVIYVQNSGPTRWIQLLNYQDRVLALDTDGTIWQLREDYYGSGFFTTQIVQESPRRGWGSQ